MKVTGTLPHLIQGVSEQEPHNRNPSQVGEQINMHSSTVKGLTRRRGTEYMDSIEVASASDLIQHDGSRMGRFAFALDEVEYGLTHRRAESTAGKETFMYLLNKSTGKFVPIVYENSAWVNDLISGGVSALASAGRYVYIAGNKTLPKVTQVDRWQAPANVQKLSAWIRDGAYSREFVLTLEKADGTSVVVKHKTKGAAYDKPLDVSGIPFYKQPETTPPEPDPYYQKLLNDQTNAYQGEVNQWSREAAEARATEAIATALANALIDLGINASAMEGSVVVDDPDYVDISISDGGNGDLAVAAGREVNDEARLTRWHWNGKVVRVRPGTGADAVSFYMEARSENGKDGFQKVAWFETAGVVHKPTHMVAQMIVHDGVAYVAQDGAGLETLAPASGKHVEFKENKVGDGITAPVPEFFNKRITMLQTFQDRLIVGAGNTVTASVSGDYLNYFRSTVLSILAKDPVEMFAHGSEGDVLRAAVMYERDLVLFGNRRQYLISGREVLTPDNRNITTIGSVAGGAVAMPEATGNYLFFGKRARDRTSLHQMQPGSTQETTQTEDVSTELDDYLRGEPVQLCGTTSPDLVLYRTTGDPTAVYAYQYLDANRQRVQNSWGKWKFAESLGVVCSVDTFEDDIVIVSQRRVGGKTYVVADILSLNVQLDKYPHLDSRCPYNTPSAWHTAAAEFLHTAADKTSEHFLLGTAYPKAAQFIEQLDGVEDSLWVGAVSPAQVDPTNPFMRDQNGQPSLIGSLTFTSGLLHVDDTAGVSIKVFRSSGAKESLRFEGRLMGRSNNILDTQPVFKGKLPFSIGEDTQSCRYELHSDSWLPLRVTGLEWVGQYYNRVRRV